MERDGDDASGLILVPVAKAANRPIRMVTRPSRLLTARCALTGWSAVNERNGERRGRKAAPNGPSARERPETALSRRPARFGNIRKPLPILALNRHR